VRHWPFSRRLIICVVLQYNIPIAYKQSWGRMIPGSMVDRSNIYTINKEMSDTEALGIVEMRDK